MLHVAAIRFHLENISPQLDELGTSERLKWALPIQTYTT
jgi:hypothetical protein